MTAPKLDEARLREVAETATAGPWGTDCRLDDRGEPWIMIGSPMGYDDVCTEDDAAFIAAANPATVLALLDALSAERERADRALQKVRERREVYRTIRDGRDPFGKDICTLWDQSNTLVEALDILEDQILATQKAEGGSTEVATTDDSQPQQ